MSELDDEIYFRSVYELPIYLPPPSPIFKAEQDRVTPKKLERIPQELEVSPQVAKRKEYKRQLQEQLQEQRRFLLKQKQLLRCRTNQAYRLLRIISSRILGERISLYVQMMETAIYEIENEVRLDYRDGCDLSDGERSHEQQELTNIILEDLVFVLSEDRGFNKAMLRELMKDCRNMIEKTTDFKFSVGERDGQGVQRYMLTVLHAKAREDSCPICGQAYLYGLAYCLNCFEVRIPE